VRRIAQHAWLGTVGLAGLLAFVGSGGCGSSSNASGSDGGSSGSSGGSSGGGSSSGSSSGGNAPDGGAVGGVPGGVAGPGAMVSACAIFPPDNAWNVQINGPNVQVIHDYDSEIPQATTLHPDWGDFTPDGYGIPYNVVPASGADLDTEFTLYPSESDPGPGGWIGADPVDSGASTGETGWPFFVGMHIEGNPAAGGTPGNLPGDQHGIVLQQGSSSCTAYEAWNCVVASSPPFQCANGAVFHLDSNALRPLGWTSADAAGLSILAGLVKLVEVQAGAVNHAVRVTFNNTANSYILPATHAASSMSVPYPPMGLRLRLKASVDISSYAAESQVVMTALKTYGLIIADNGSDWFFQGDSDNGWNNTAKDGKDTIIDELVGDFKSLTGSDFEAIYSGDPIMTGL
jgi:hypothetical protein